MQQGLEAYFFKISGVFLSLTRKMNIVDANDTPLYSVYRRGIFSLTYDLKTPDGVCVSSIRRKIFAWRRTWTIFGPQINSTIRRALAIKRTFKVVEGDRLGAVIAGNWTSLRFRIEQEGAEIATTKFKLFSVRSTQVVEVPRAEDALFSVLALVIVSLDRSEDENNPDRD